ncbi:MAG TPA: VCBS repeat-containing protein [Bryobacteraceae bacterium]|jgi:hypothetical protein
MWRCLILPAALIALGFQSGSLSRIRFHAQKLASGIDVASAGLTVADIDSDGKPEALVWSNAGIQVFRYGTTKPLDCGLNTVREVVSISPGDFNNDGLTDLAILTQSDAELWTNRRGRFEKLNVVIPEGAYNKAVWLDFDHDNDLDLFLLGDKSALMRNEGERNVGTGFTNVSNNFPFVAGRAVDGATLGKDLFVIFSDRPGVFYEDKLRGRFEAQDLNVVAAGAKAVVAANPDLLVTTPSGTFPVFKRGGSFTKGPSIAQSSVAPAVGNFESRGHNDIAVPGAILRNDSSGRLSDIKVPDADASALTAVDFDGDGRIDLIEVRRDGSLMFLRNESAR